MRISAPGRQPEGTWPIGRAGRGYITTGDLPMRTPQTDAQESQAPPRHSTHTRRLPTVADLPPGLQRLHHEAVTHVDQALGQQRLDVSPMINVFVSLEAGEGADWAGAVGDVRVTLMHSSAWDVSYGPGDLQGHRAVWRVEVRGSSVEALHRDLSEVARRRRDVAIWWAPGSQTRL